MTDYEQDDTPYPAAPPPAMAQEHICLCAYLFQQQSAENGLSCANGYCVRGILPYLEFHLLFQ